MCVPVAIVLLAAATPVAQPGTALPLGSSVAATVASGSPPAFGLEAETAGLLTVVVQGDGAVDLVIRVADDIGQTLPRGRADVDLGGDTGAELLTVTVGQPGTYQVLVEARPGEGDFQIAGGWIPFPPVAVEPDPDGRPTGASVLEPGPAVENSLHLPGGDHWDWYAVMPKADRMVTVVVEAPTGDLVLEMFETGNAEPTIRSDQDLAGVTGNESITAPVASGETRYFRVSSAFANTAEPIPYRIRVGVM